MNSADIIQRVKDGADAKIGDTVDILLAILRRQHTQQSYRNECFCEYCRFIRKDYTVSKIILHKIKRRFNYYDGIQDLTDTGKQCMLMAQNRLISQMKIVSLMKHTKMEMWKDVL
jgi:hypothetical protein